LQTLKKGERGLVRAHLLGEKKGPLPFSYEQSKGGHIVRKRTEWDIGNTTKIMLKEPITELKPPLRTKENQKKK